MCEIRERLCKCKGEGKIERKGQGGEDGGKGRQCKVKEEAARSLTRESVTEIKGK